MGKTAKLIGVLLMIAMLPMALFGCGGGGKDMSDSEYVGKWNATAAKMDGIGITVSDLFSEFSIDLKDDGKCTLNIDGDKKNGTWDETSGGFIVDNSITVKVDGNKGTTEYEGVTLSFTHDVPTQ